MTHDPLQPLTPEEGGLHGNIPDTTEAREWFQRLGEKAHSHDPMPRKDGDDMCPYSHLPGPECKSWLCDCFEFEDKWGMSQK